MSKIDEFCFGIVTIITSNNLVLTGRVKSDTVEVDGAVFIRLTLTAPVLFIPATGGPAVEQPFYMVGDIVLINVDQIVTVGPSHI